MAHHNYLHEAGLHLIPAGIDADRNLMPEQSAGSGAAAAPAQPLRVVRTQLVHGGRTDAFQLGTPLGTHF